MKKIFIGITMLLYLLKSPCLFGQEFKQTIRGKVTDSQSGAPLIGTTVVLVGSDPVIGAITDIQGEFIIRDVPIGRHAIRVSFIGYEDAFQEGILVGSGKQPFLNVSLTESFTEMQEVVVVAEDQTSGKPVNELAVISAQSFSVEQTSRYAATFNDPARAALSFAGVTTGGDDILNEIVIRGNSPKGLLWRIEGVEIPNPNHFADIGSSAGGISMLSNNMLENSDFFTGAFPAEYGNAFSGVFDIQLRNGNNQQREYAVQAGFLGLAFAGEGPFSTESKSSYLVNYRYSTLALFDNLEIDITGENEDITFSDLSFKLNFPTEKAGVFSFWGLGGRSLDDTRASEEDENPYNEQAANDLGIAGLNHIIYLNNDTYLESALSVSSRLTEYQEDSLGMKEEWKEEFTENAIRISTQLNKKFDSRNTLRTGWIISHLYYQLFSQSYDDAAGRLTTRVDSDGSTQFVQLYGNWNHRFSEKLTMNAGLHFSKLLLNNNSSLEPRLGFRYRYRPAQNFSFGLGLHSRMETPGIYLGTIEQPDGSLVRANKNLDLMKAFHLVGGYERSIGNLWRIKTEVYYQYLYDVPVSASISDEGGFGDFSGAFSLLNVSSGFVTGELSNDGAGRNYGIELTIDRKISGGFYSMFTGSLFESQYKGKDGILRNTRYNANYLLNAVTGKEWQVGKQQQNLISMNLRLIWSGNNRFTPIDLDRSAQENGTVRIPGRSFQSSLEDYRRLDFGIKYIKNRPRTTSVIALDVQNITGVANEFNRFYDGESGSIVSGTQLGLFPNLSYRLEF